MNNKTGHHHQPGKRNETDLVSLDYAIQLIILIAIGLLAFSFF